jgi:hypothetical protein
MDALLCVAASGYHRQAASFNYKPLGVMEPTVGLQRPFVQVMAMWLVPRAVAS